MPNTLLPLYQIWERQTFGKWVLGQSAYYLQMNVMKPSPFLENEKQAWEVVTLSQWEREVFNPFPTCSLLKILCCVATYPAVGFQVSLCPPPTQFLLLLLLFA